MATSWGGTKPPHALPSCRTMSAWACCKTSSHTNCRRPGASAVCHASVACANHFRSRSSHCLSILLAKSKFVPRLNALTWLNCTWNRKGATGYLKVPSIAAASGTVDGGNGRCTAAAHRSKLQNKHWANRRVTFLMSRTQASCWSLASRVTRGPRCNLRRTGAGGGRLLC